MKSVLILCDVPEEYRKEVAKKFLGENPHSPCGPIPAHRLDMLVGKGALFKDQKSGIVTHSGKNYAEDKLKSASDYVQVEAVVSVNVEIKLAAPKSIRHEGVLYIREDLCKSAVV